MATKFCIVCILLKIQEAQNFILLQNALKSFFQIKSIFLIMTTKFYIVCIFAKTV